MNLKNLMEHHGELLSFMENNGYSGTYQVTSLGSHMSGLKIFLGMDPHTEQFLVEILEHLPKKRDILKVYSDEEYDKIIGHLDKSENISFRNKAISRCTN